MPKRKQYFNANGIPVVQGSYVSSSITGNMSLNHSSNDQLIADAITKKQQQEVDERMSYYEALDKRSKLEIGDREIPRGELQPKACKDIFWSILFYAHLIAMGIVTYQYSPLVLSDLEDQYSNQQRFLSEWDGVSWWKSYTYHDSYSQRYLDEQNQETVELEMKTIWVILLVSGATSILVTSLAMSLMVALPTSMVKIALAFNLLVTIGACIAAFMVGAILVGAIAAIGVLFTIYYTCVVWKKIPFAASTLTTAITAVKSNMGLAFFAYNNLLVTFLWSLWWSIAFLATVYVLGDCNAEGYCENDIPGFLVFSFLVSFYWTTQIIKNVVHVTVAGTVGTWWFVPGEARSCCSSAVVNSYWRSITTSFGSICFGSLFVALIQAARDIVYSIRTEENSLILCILDCILLMLERLLEYFNKWAYIYVGLYGYGFLEASMTVVSLFKARGWSSIIADYLVDTVLLMVSICVGIFTGIIGALVGHLMQQDGYVISGAFLAGAMIGFVLCSTLFGLISSAVNTVIVCFAEAPAEFQANHPQLSQQMVLAWREAYPAEFGY